MKLRLRRVYNQYEEHCFQVFKDGELIHVVLEYFINEETVCVVPFV